MDVECLVMTHFENILEAVARVRRLFKLKMCLHFVILPELWLIKMEETHVSAHMLFVKSLIFIHNPCYYLVSRPVPSSANIFFIYFWILVLHISFLRLGSFSYTMQMFCVSASFLNLADLLPIFIAQLVFKKLMDFFNFCMFPGRTRQTFGFLFSSSAFSEET